MEKVYVGSFGKTEILVDARVDLTGETVALKIKKPKGGVTTWPGTVYGGTQVRHVVERGELDEAGEYKLQPLVLGADGVYVEKGATGSFRVFNEFE